MSSFLRSFAKPGPALKGETIQSNRAGDSQIEITGSLQQKNYKK